MSGAEPGGDNLSIADRLIANLLFNAGWILLLIGGDPIGQALILSGEHVVHWVTATVILGLGAVSLIVSYLWPPSKPETRELFARFLAPIAARSRFLAFTAMIALWMFLTFQIASIRSDLDMYVMPRKLTQQQANDLTAYLLAHGPYAVSVRADPTNREALEYASEIFNAIHKSNWTADFNANPSNDDPKFTGDGVSIQETGANSRPNDPDHNPEQILNQAFYAANIEINGSGSAGGGTYKLLVLVGHRPVAIGRKLPLSMRLAPWLNEIDQWFR